MLDKIKNYGLAVLAVLSAILGALFIFFKKKAEAEQAKAENAETKGHVDQIDQQIDEIKKEAEEKKNEEVSKEDLSKFLGDSDPK